MPNFPFNPYDHTTKAGFRVNLSNVFFCYISSLNSHSQVFFQMKKSTNDQFGVSVWATKIQSSYFAVRPPLLLYETSLTLKSSRIICFISSSVPSKLIDLLYLGAISNEAIAGLKAKLHQLS